MCDHSDLLHYFEGKIKFYCYISDTPIDKEVNIHYNCKICNIKETVNCKVKILDYKVELEKKADIRSLAYVKIINQTYEISETTNREYLIAVKLLNYYRKNELLYEIIDKKLKEYSLELQTIKKAEDDFLDYMNKIILTPGRSKIIYNKQEIINELLIIYENKLQKIENIIENIYQTMTGYSKLFCTYLENYEPNEIKEFIELLNQYFISKSNKVN